MQKKPAAAATTGKNRGRNDNAVFAGLRHGEPTAAAATTSKNRDQDGNVGLDYLGLGEATAAAATTAKTEATTAMSASTTAAAVTTNTGLGGFVRGEPGHSRHSQNKSLDCGAPAAAAEAPPKTKLRRPGQMNGSGCLLLLFPQ